MDALPDALRQGIEEFNQACFFEAHDTWEELWHETSGPLEDFYQGLIQLAVGFYHLLNDNRRGARNQLAKGLDKLAGYRPVCQGIDVQLLSQDTRRWLDRLRDLGEREFSIDPAELPRIYRLAQAKRRE